MTNPNNAVGTNGAFGGRTSVNAFNDMMNVLSRGIISGWACVPNSGMEVSLGGSGSVRDVAAAEDNAGNKTSINNISGSPISVTIPTAPASNSRIDSIVAYVNNPPTGTSTATDNYGACGLIVVAGTVSSTPSAPSESAIRAAITADGASGTTAYYVVLANITISSGTTDLTSSNISQSSMAQISANSIDFTPLNNVIVQNLTFTCSSWSSPLTNNFTIKHSSNGKIAFLSGHVSWGRTGGSGNETVTSSDTGLRPKADTSFNFLRFVTTGNLAGITASADAVLKTNGSIVITVSKNSGFTQQDFIFDNIVLIVD